MWRTHIWLPAGIEICALQHVCFLRPFRQFHNIFTGIEVRGRSLMTEFTDLTTVWRLHPSLLFTSSPPPPPSPSPLPHDGITPHLPTQWGTHWIYSVLIRLFLPHACNSVHSQGKQLCLLDVDFDFFTLHEFDIIMSFFLGNRCDFCCFLFVFALYIYIYVLQWWLISREGK